MGLYNRNRISDPLEIHNPSFHIADFLDDSIVVAALLNKMQISMGKRAPWN